MTGKQRKEFLNFPLDLYKGNPYYIPPMYMDEKKIFRKDYVYNGSCDSVFFNAYKDGKIAGRIQGIIQRDANAKNGEKRARFTRIEAIDDADVFKALCLGADGVLIARPYVTAVYGGGAEGVAVYTAKIGAELVDTMKMCGAGKLSDLSEKFLFKPSNPFLA